MKITALESNISVTKGQHRNQVNAEYEDYDFPGELSLFMLLHAHAPYSAGNAEFFLLLKQLKNFLAPTEL